MCWQYRVVLAQVSVKSTIKCPKLWMDLQAAAAVGN